MQRLCFLIIFFIFLYVEAIPTAFNNDSFIDCNCSLPHTIKFNESNINHSLKPTNHERYCPNMTCSWVLDFEELLLNKSNIIQVYPDHYLNSYDNFVIFECQSNKIMYAPNATEDGYDSTYLYTQSLQVCVNFTSKSVEKDLEYMFYWHIDFSIIYKKNVSVYNLLLTDDNPLIDFDLIVDYNSYYINDEDIFVVINVSTDTGPIDLHLIGGSKFYEADYRSIYYIYSSDNLSNYYGFYQYSPYSFDDSHQFMSFTSESSYITVLYIGPPMDYGYAQLIFRRRKSYVENCPMSENVFYVEETKRIQYRAMGTGTCQILVIIPETYVSSGDIPTLRFKNLKYKGHGTVVVEDAYSKETLFEFDENSGNLWEGVLVYNTIVSIFIPPNGHLDMTTTFNYVRNDTERDFNTSMLDIFTLPSIFGDWGVSKAVSCLSGFAKFSIEVAYANMTPDATLLITNGSFSYNFTDTTLENETFVIHGTSILIKCYGKYVYEGMEDDRYSNLMVKIDGNYIGNPTNSSKFYIVIIGISIGLVLISIFGIVIVYITYKNKKKSKRYDQMFDMLREMKLISVSVMNFKGHHDKFFINSTQISIEYEKILGYGSTSIVYKAYLSGISPLHTTLNMLETQRFNNCDVAIKIAQNYDTLENELFYREINVMKELGYHENVMSMLGWTVIREKPCLIFEVAHTNLLMFLRDLRENELNEGVYKNFVSILWQVTRGMQYISSKGFIHRDLAARNIVLCHANNVKICDFGLCSRQNENLAYQATLTKRLPLKWLSIEALIDHIFSEKSDVWSFGILMYEVYTFGQVPYIAMNFEEVLKFLKSGQRLARPEYMAENLYEIAMKCWMMKPEDRPNFSKLEEVFREMLEEENKEHYEFLMS